LDPEIEDESREIQVQIIKKSEKHRTFSQLDEAAGQNQEPKSLVLPQKCGIYRGSTARWWAHALIFNAWLRIVIQNLPMPINATF